MHFKWSGKTTKLHEQNSKFAVKRLNSWYIATDVDFCEVHVDYVFSTLPAYLLAVFDVLAQHISA